MGVNGIYGLSGSGLDIESMVKIGMMSRQSQYDKMQQTYTKNEWKKESYIEIYDKINDYNTNTLAKYKYSANMNSRSATSSNSNIKVTADASAPAMNHNITVKNTATSAYLVGTKKLDSTNLQSLLGSGVEELKFSLGDANGVNDVSSHAEVSFSSTALASATKAKNLLTEGVLSHLNAGDKLISIDRVSVSGGKVHFIGLDNDANTSKVSIDSTVTALSFYVEDKTDGTTHSDSINITYGDLASILNDDDATFQDFVDLLNKKIGESNQKAESNRHLNVTASYDEDAGLVFTNKDAGKNSVAFYLDNDGIGQYVAEALYQAADENQRGLFVKTSDGMHRFSGDSTKMLTNEGTAASLKQDGLVNFSFKVTSDTTIYDLVSQINTGGKTSIRATYDASNGTVSFYNTKTGAENGLAITTDDENTAKLFYNMGLKDTGAAADLSSVATMDFGFTTSTETRTINVTDENGHLVYETDSDGNRVKTTITKEDGTTEEVDKVKTTTTTVTNTTWGGASKATTIVSGKNASVLVDGNEINDIDSNIFTRNGVTYDISNVTSKSSATISVTQDTEKIIENVKSFVEDYNTLLNDLYEMYRETPNSSYAPLTEAQKNEMTEEQIKKWEEKAKSGMLYHDTTLRKIIDNMRSAISESVSSIDSKGYDSAYKLGISTTGLYGQLKLDEDKLRAALVDDPDSVYNVFAKLDKNAKEASDAKNGIAQRLTGGIGSVLNKATKSIESVAGTSSDTSDDSTLSTLMRELQTRMSNFRSMMTTFENSLYKKYDAMESALASLGTQLNYVGSMFSS